MHEMHAWTVHYADPNPLKQGPYTLWKWYFMHMINQFWFWQFSFKNFMNKHMIICSNFMPCDEVFGKYESKGEQCKKKHSNWSLGSKDMAIWSFKHTLPWFDHNSLTIHHEFMILDFLEMGEKDLQLLCWTKFHLKPPWCWKVELKLVQKLAIFGNLKITGHFPFLETFDLDSNPSR